MTKKKTGEKGIQNSWPQANSEPNQHQKQKSKKRNCKHMKYEKTDQTKRWKEKKGEKKNQRRTVADETLLPAPGAGRSIGMVAGTGICTAGAGARSGAAGRRNRRGRVRNMAPGIGTGTRARPGIGNRMRMGFRVRSDPSAGRVRR